MILIYTIGTPLGAMQVRGGKKTRSMDEVKELMKKPETKKKIKETIADMKASGEKKRSLTVEEFKEMLEKPEVKKGIENIKSNTKSKIMAAYRKQRDLEKEQKKRFDNTAIHARRDAIKDDPRWKEQKDIFLRNLHNTVNDKKLIATIQNELATLTKTFNKSPSLEKAMFKDLNPLLVVVDPKMLSVYNKVADVFRQVIPAIKVEEVDKMAKDLKELVDMNSIGKDKTIEKNYTTFRNFFKDTFGNPGKNGKYWKSDHYDAFRPFDDTELISQNKEKNEKKLLEREPIWLDYSRVLKAISDLYKNKSDIKNDAKLAAIALATGMREAEIMNDDIIVSTIKGKPNWIHTDGISKQRDLESSQKPTTRPVIYLTGKQVVEAVEYIRSFDKRDFKFKLSFIEKHFGEVYKEKVKKDGDQITSVLRAIYANTVHDVQEYNPKFLPLGVLLEQYFGHKPSRGTSLWYETQFRIKDDINNTAPVMDKEENEDEKQNDNKEETKKEKKTEVKELSGDCDEIRQLKDEIFALRAFIKKKEETRKNRYESKVRNVRTEEELIAEGKKFLKKNPTPTTRQFRQGLSIGNDKVKWLMEKLGARRTQKEWNKDQKAKREARKKEQEQEQEEADEENEE